MDHAASQSANRVSNPRSRRQSSRTSRLQDPPPEQSCVGGPAMTQKCLPGNFSGGQTSHPVMFRIMCLMLLALSLRAADFRISSYTLGTSNFSLTFPTAAGRIYGVERAESLGQPWSVQAAYCGTGSDITF